MTKHAKSFCYYCNQVADFHCQSIVQCSSCPTVCHKDCLSFECNPTIPVIKMKKVGNKKWAIINKNDHIPKVASYICNKCSLKSTPFNTIITNSRGAIKKRFYQDDEEDLGKNYRKRNIADCLEPNYLNSLFYNTDPAQGDVKDSSHAEQDEGFTPIPDRYYYGDCITSEDYGINLSSEKSDKEPKAFSSLGINIRSLANTKNFAQLQVFVKSLCFKPTIIAINETYLKSNEPGPHSKLDGYSFISNCRKSHKGGGVGLYIHESLQYKVREDLTIMDDKVFESFFIETLNLKHPIIYGTVYRSPIHTEDAVTPFITHLDRCLKIIDKSKKQCFIQGDLNFNLIDLDDSNVHLFKDTMFDYSYYSLINKPTRVTSTSATCIDHIWSNVYDDGIANGIITEMIADHMITFQSCNIAFKQSTSKKVLKIEKINFKKLEMALNETRVDHILNCHDVDAAYELLHTTIDTAVKKSTYEVRKKSRDSNDWFDRDLFKLRAKRQMLYHKYIKNKSTNNKTAYDETKKRYEKLCIQKKKHYYQSLITKYNSNMRRTWGVINDLLGKSRCKERFTSMNVDGEFCTDSQVIANQFNKFFNNIPKNLHKDLPKMNDNIRIDKCLKFLKGRTIADSVLFNPTSFDEVFKIIHKFKNKSSTGLDNTSPKVFKHFPDKVINCYVHIFNLSITQGKFIECFKTAKVVPVYKSKNKHEMSNFRPISLLPVASKILEKIIHVRLYSFLSRNVFFLKNQFGFRANHSTDLAASLLINQICDALNNKQKVMSVFLDMSKAFDCVDHNILLQKMLTYGVRGNAFSWFKSYLSERHQRVEFNGTLSENTCKVECGVPQGSILGPLLYLIYINDINQCLTHCHVTLYADDTTLIVTAKTYEDLYRFVNEDLSALSKWLCLNKLTMNIKKTKYITYSLSKRTALQRDDLKVFLNGATIEKVDTFKYLGIYIDEHLTWKPHMNKILSKIRGNLGVVRRISCFLTRRTLIQLFHSMIMSHIRYGIIVWHYGQASLRKKIQACANKFLRLIFFKKQRDSVKSLMIENKILSINQIFHLEISKLMQRVALNFIPSPFTDIFQNQERTLSMTTRSSSSYFQPLMFAQKCHQSISYTGPLTWGIVPSNIKVSLNNADFVISSYQNDALISSHKVRLLKTFTKRMKKYSLRNIDFI